MDEKDDTPKKYVVQKKFTDWSTGRRYVQGELVRISGDEFNNFRWAFETGRLVPLNEEETNDRKKKRGSRES